LEELIVVVVVVEAEPNISSMALHTLDVVFSYLIID
jgi:hypothetical protein